ncbi:CamS family sex pheromone protein [Heyndrickxia acidiproducens]|uniref:CamS family sex pheromone protein n=1 Tax=Heyndrickxia acidiproducens TaxID=1121084 RepID=UPI00036F334E|nr:CamS family sex pheromone protein [Heyndrickxia acidiproducens]
MKKMYPLLLSVILLAGCTPNFGSNDKVVQKKNNKKETSIVSSYQISSNYYKNIYPYKTSKSRGLVVGNLNTSYDIDEFETGLMRVAQKNYSPDDYLFQEGQVLSKDTVTKWLNRKYTSEQLKANGLSAKDNIGLNPLKDGKGTARQQNEKNPIYLTQILEQDYLTKDSKGNVKLAGVAIGLALNSVYYYQKEKYGSTYEVKISQNTLNEKGKQIAREVVQRLRNMSALKNVPITIALYKQQSKDSVIPGNYFAYATVEKNSTNVDNWKEVNEKYYLFPSESATRAHRDDEKNFENFKADIEDFFPNYTGCIGRARYSDGQLVDLSIDIPIQFHGQAEVIGFTQYVAGLVVKTFPDYVNLQVNITSNNEAKALIAREANEKDPIVHIYK